jgi:uncharacterized protein YndB with AHSA1/START domain
MTDNITVTITTPSDREAVVTREFNAPAHLVFEAITNPALIKRWYGLPAGLEQCESDARLGGSWRFGFSVGGKRMAKFGVYTEFDPPRRFVRTERWEGWDAGETLLTVELIERHGKTTLTQRMLFPSQDVRDAMMKTGLTSKGMSEFYGRLEELLAKLEAEKEEMPR